MVDTAAIDDQVEQHPEPPPHDPPYPPYELARRVGSLRDAADPYATYEEFGRVARERIIELLGDRWSFRGRRVLDFGCGAGRALRHFLDEAESADFVGCDIDEASIAWLRENLCPPLSAFVNPEVPPIDQPSASFDLIYALSVFTHLTESWSAWLLELHRLLRPDGLLIATFLGTDRASRVLPPEVVGDGLSDDLTGMNETASGRSWDRGGPLVFHSPWWIRAHWGRAFEILTLEASGFWPFWDQGYVVMRRRSVELSPRDLESPEPDEPREVAAAIENVRQLARQMTPMWERLDDLRARNAELRARVERLRQAR